MKAIEIDDLTINKTHCDWIIKQAKEMKALFSYDSKSIIHQNKIRALATIETMEYSLSELKLYIENI